MPNWNHIVREYLAVLRLPPEREIEIVEELAPHLEAAYEAALVDGLSEAEAEARAVQGYDWRLLECELSRAEQRLAARALQPSLELIERRGGMRMESLLQDLRFGARMLLKNPGFTLIAALTLAVGIIANVTNFGLVSLAKTPTRFGATALVGQAERKASAQPIAFTHATLIDMTAAPPQSDMTVLVVGNRIVAIGKTGKVRAPRN